ncbi:MAG: winged helix-turn-helix domain-containing protein [Acidobacteriia bacterium]|nr:winged helix-turn-helix domain-containing protein [Terriglobia bacterium]
MPHSKTAIGEVELDLGRYELRRLGRRVKLEKKPMELLIFLVGRRERLVSRQDIVAKLWQSDLFVDTERNINNIVRKIRRALGDDPAKPRFLETVVGKGYRFIGPIRVIDAHYPQTDLPGGKRGAASAAEHTVWAADRLSLAVLPLRLAGNSTDDSGLSLGFTDALVTRLGNLPGVDVLPISAVLNVPATAAPAEVAARFGVRFVVHGALQIAKTQSRLWVEMYDAHLQSTCLTRRCELDVNSLFELKDDIAARIAGALNRPLGESAVQIRARYSKDPLAYTQFMQGYRHSSSGDPRLLEEATEHLMNAVARDPGFALAHAVLSLVCAARHFEFDPSRTWLEKAEFHCERSLELDSNLPEGHVAKAFLLWGPSKNFQHLEAIAELKRALALQKNLPHAYNRMGTILAHIGLLDQARTMYEMGSAFDPRKAVSHSIVQAYIWNGDYELAREELHKWRTENPANKYAVYFAPYLAMLNNQWEEAKSLFDEAMALMGEDPLIVSLQGVMHAMQGRSEEALACMSRACANPKSFGHAHHTHYQIACILSLLGRPEAALEWLERSVDTGFACWPFFLKDPCLKNFRSLPQFELLVSSLQGKYPDHLGLL